MESCNHELIEGVEKKMDEQRLDHFRKILLEQLRRHTENVRTDQAAALEATDDGVKDSVDMSLQDVNREIAFRLGERESQMVADIDQALMRIDEGTYGECARCGKTIDERRLEALPTARYDAACQAEIETSQGLDDIATL
jgi:DnaK suppressor protein